MCPVADVQVGHIDASLYQLFHLCYEALGVNDDTVADNTSGIWVENARRDKTKFELLFFVHHAVPRVAAPLIANHKIRSLREFINCFPFPFISPLCSDNCNYHHDVCPSLLVNISTDLHVQVASWFLVGIKKKTCTLVSTFGRCVSAA